MSRGRRACRPLKCVPAVALDCPECGSPMNRKWTPRFERWFYSCSRWPACDGSHGCHPDGSPLGVPANKETKRLRIEAHEAFDRLWKEGRMTRSEAYRWLSGALGSDGQVHIGQMNADQCRRVIEIMGPRSWGFESPATCERAITFTEDE